ncbi:MAG: hypothetical protein WCT29_00690 [Candidatus Paceibacterota bacterium]|jgi:hypothetical protein
MKTSAPISKSQNSESIFFQNILHFLLSTHIIPLREYSLQYVPKNQAKIVTLKTSFGEDISTYLEELPTPSDKDFNQISARILINGCYEIFKESSIKEITSSEVVEFFRHIRNASSHKGKFIFKKDEPRKKAKWRELEITRDLNGSDLFDFIAIGDVILLLQDIDDWEIIK